MESDVLKKKIVMNYWSIYSDMIQSYLQIFVAPVTFVVTLYAI